MPHGFFDRPEPGFSKGSQRLEPILSRGHTGDSQGRPLNLPRSCKHNGFILTLLHPTVSAHVAVAHYPEGAGHATRMMGVARALQERGASVTLAGGGPGAKYYAANNFDAYEPTRVDYVRDFQGPETVQAGVWRVLSRSIPDTGSRIRDLIGWLRAHEPDGLVTDDMFAAVSATVLNIPLYVMTHNAATFYRNPLVRVASRGLNLGQRIAARRFFYPTVWPPHEGDPPQVSRVPPVVLTGDHRDGDGGPAEPGVIVVPSTYSSDGKAIADELQAAGFAVTRVGGPNWTTVPAMVPVLKRAKAVVCSGYSTVMEAAVAGTPCVFKPVTNEQRGVGNRLEAVDGFEVVDRMGAIPDALSSIGEMDPFVNGAPAIAERILDDLGTDR